MKTIGTITTTLAIVVFITIYNGAVLTLLWRWFAVPVFGLPELSIPAAIGIILILDFARNPPAPKDSESEKWTEVLARSLVFSMIRGSAALVGGLAARFFL